MDKIDNLLKDMDINLKGRKVFKYLLEHGVSPVADISHETNIPKSSVYDSLNELLNKSLVVEYSTERRKEYGISDPNQLTEINNERIKKLQKEHEEFIETILNTKKIESVARPKISFYSGKEGIRQAFRDNLWHKKCKVSYLMWPVKDMFDVMGLDFSIWHSHTRLDNDVFLYVIQKENDKDFATTVPEAEKLLKTESWVSNVKQRTAPSGLDWKMSFWIYDNKCLFASGGTERIAFVINSKEFSDLMLVLFKKMWNFCGPEDDIL